MNILFVCHRFPFPPDRGGKIRPFNFIRHFSQNHTVTVATLAHSQQEQEAGAGLGKFCSEVISEVVPNSARWPRAAAALLSSRPSSEAYFWSPRLRRRIEEKCQKQRFDVVWVHCAFVARYALGLQADLRVLDYGDLDSGKWSDYGRFRSFPLSVGYRLEAWKLRRYEITLCRQFDQCTVTTPGELQEFQNFNTDAPCTVIPNGVDFKYFEPIAAAPRGSDVIVFLGRMDYFPNISGIMHFAHKIFPIILKRNPHVHLRIIGSNPVAKVRNLARNPAISVTGFVPDIRPHLSGAAVSVVPLKLARGTQNKMLESMAMGLPVVATPEAARGIQAIPGKHLLVAPDAESFADAVCKLLGDHEVRTQLAMSAREHIIQVHDWSASMQILDQILDRVAQNMRSAAATR